MRTVLVCGGREYADAPKVAAVLDLEHARQPIGRVVAGDAGGADRLALRWAMTRGIPSERFEADWAAYGLSAGPRRNARMLAEARPDLVIAFPGNRGTADMVARARRAGVEVRRVNV